MNDEQLSLILEAFKVNNNEFELNTSSFRIISDHTLFVTSFIINDNFIITRDNGVDKRIVISKELNVGSLLEEVVKFLKSISTDENQCNQSVNILK